MRSGAQFKAAAKTAVPGMTGALGWPSDKSFWPYALRVLEQVRRSVASDIAASQAQSWSFVLVGLPIGLVLYFALNFEPVQWPAQILACGLFVCTFASRGIRRWVLLLLCLICFGFSLGGMRTAWIKAPVLERPHYRLTLTGTIHAIEPAQPGQFLYLSPTDFKGLKKVRLRYEGDQSLAVGQSISMTASLFPPAAPIVPQGLDLQQQAYFQQIGAYGKIYEISEVSGQSQPATVFEKWRVQIGDHLTRQYAGDTGQVMAALLVGYKKGISAETLDDVRKSGLAHLLAISGLHMGMVVGLGFLLFRNLFLVFSLKGRSSLWNWVNLDPKKMAVIGAAGLAVFYLGLSGGTTPTVRAFIMALAALIAIVFNRNVLSIRLAALAVVIVLLMRPEALISVSFQLSFAAVFALIAVGQTFKNLRAPKAERAWWQRATYPVMGIASTSLIASFATAPFALAVFNRVALAGVAANIVAVPLTGFWILPFGLLGVFLQPLGLGDLGYLPMSWGVDLMLEWAKFFAGFEWALIKVPKLPSWLLVFMGMGFWCALHFAGKIRWAVIGSMALGFVFIASMQTPHLAFVASSSGKSAYLDPDGFLYLSSGSPDSFEAQLWSSAAGHLEPAKASQDVKRTCDKGVGCLLRAPIRIAWPETLEAAREDCVRADLIIAPKLYLRSCDAPTVDRGLLRREGSALVKLTSAGISIETVKQSRGQRPWTRY